MKNQGKSPSKVRSSKRISANRNRAVAGTLGPGSPGIGDDAAIWRPRAGYETILTCDWFLEGTHFLADRHPADSVGWKCLARAVSDIAAMGGEPRCFLLSLALPPNPDRTLAGPVPGRLARASRTLRCPIAGGDTTQREKSLST